MLIIKPLPCVDRLHALPLAARCLLKLHRHHPCSPRPPGLPIRVVTEPTGVAQLNSSELPTEVIYVIMSYKGSLHISSFHHGVKEAGVDRRRADTLLLLYSCEIGCRKVVKLRQGNVEVSKTRCWLLLYWLSNLLVLLDFI